MASIAFFRDGLFPSGGIETWLYNISKRWGNTHDITIYYDHADPKQLDRLQRLVRCIEYVGQDIETDTAVWCYDFLGFDTTKAKRKVHVVHADYRYVYNFDKGLQRLPKVDEIYAVSKEAARSAQRLFNRHVDVLYNPLPTESVNRPISILSATRLTKEKGVDRMVKLDQALQRAGVEYIWEIYTPSYTETDITERFSSSVVFKKPVMFILGKMKQADFMVQLSDTESFGYSIVESMALGTNLIVTDIPVLKELNVNKHNAIIVPLRKYCVNYNSIVKKIVARSLYKPPESDYDSLLGEKTKSNYKPTIVKNITSFDMMLPDGRWLEPGHKAIMDSYDGKSAGIEAIK